jgi:MmyB-like transcription regulator ligand binding domain
VAESSSSAVAAHSRASRGIERNSVWRHLVGPGGRAVHTPEQKAEFEAALVADLRLTAARYPTDQRLKQLARDLAGQSPRFAKLWESGALEPHQDFGRRKVIDHPDVGRITVDCDTLIVAADDLRIMIYTAEPDTEDAERLALAVVLGTQSLID